ncbi:MAG: tetratricopeptide repeat protein [Flavobacteriales bacterium]|nr:tetratricopeptide repeat protein [Flavobacteriales bacterium]
MSVALEKKNSKWIYAFAAIILTAIAFFPSLSNGFTNWDDEVYLLNNENIREFSWEKIKYWFGAYHHGNYHPLTMISYMWEYSMSELNPRVYHFNNYILHLLNTGLVFFFVYKLVDKKEVALIVATLFGIHPMHVESVAWVSERKDLLYTAFYLGSLIVYLGYKHHPDWKKYLLLIFLFVASLLSKSAAVVLPVVLLLIDYYQERKLTIKLVIEKVPFFLLSIIFGILAIKSQNATEAIASYDTFTTTQRALFAGYGSLVYIAKVFWPFGLTAFHPYPALVENGTRLPYLFYIVPALSIVVFGGALFLWKKSKGLVFGLFFYLVNVALVLQFVSVGSAIYAERYSYMAYVGLFFMIAMGLSKIIEKQKKFRKPIYIVMITISIGLSFLTFQQTTTWKNSVSLWKQYNTTHPESRHGEYKIAEYYMDLGNNELALEQFLYIGQKYDSTGRAYMGAGNILGRMGKAKEALVYFNLAEKEYDPNGNMQSLWVNRAITFSMLKQYENAFEDYTKALEHMPNDYQIYTNRGFAYLEHGDLDKAINDFSTVLQVESNNIRLYFMRALAQHRKKNMNLAIADYSKVLQLNPNHKDAYHNRAICFEAQGNYKQALDGILKAQQLGKQENPAYIERLQKLAKN